MTHYEVLELPANAPATDIRRAYRRLVLLTHPDRTPDPAAHARYLAINAAYEVLSNVGQRQAYDLTLRYSQPAAPPEALSGRARDAARRAPRSAGPPPSARTADFKAQYALLLRVARPIMIGALLLCASLGLDFMLASAQPETVTRTDGIAYKCVVHYTANGRFTLEDEIPTGSRLWVRRTPLWRTAISAHSTRGNTELTFTSVYKGPCNFFWLGLLLTSFISLRPQFTNDQRLMATLVSLVCMLLTLLTMFSNQVP